MAAGKPGQTVKQTDFRAKAQRFSPLVAFLPVHPAGRFHFLSTEMSPYPEGFSEERKLWQKNMASEKWDTRQRFSVSAPSVRRSNGFSRTDLLPELCRQEGNT